MHPLSIHAVPAARPAYPMPAQRHSVAARQLLGLTARVWLPAALLRPRTEAPRLDERVRQTGEW